MTPHSRGDFTSLGNASPNRAIRFRWVACHLAIFTGGFCRSCSCCRAQEGFGFRWLLTYDGDAERRESMPSLSGRIHRDPGEQDSQADFTNTPVTRRGGEWFVLYSDD